MDIFDIISSQIITNYLIYHIPTSPVHTGDYSRRIRRLSPKTATVADDKLSPNSATIVASVDRALSFRQSSQLRRRLLEETILVSCVGAVSFTSWMSGPRHYNDTGHGA